MNKRNRNDAIKRWFRKHNIQFRKVDLRRSENIVLNINYNCLHEQKRILLCYIDYNRAQYQLCHVKTHTNLAEMNQMIQVLSQMGFCIDVCDCNNEEVAYELQSNRYDYIIGFGDNYKLAREKNPKAKSIIYMTENPYDISRREEQKRIDYFYKRHGIKTDFARTGKYYHKDDELNSDVIICLGETQYYDNTGKKVLRVYPSANKNHNYTNNDCSAREKNSFLMFGVKGFVHKGCDLLLEVFMKHPEWTLYMCGNDIQEECNRLGYKLPKNVIDCGYVDVNSSQFVDLVNKCYFNLLPSCSEGMSTSLLTGMMHGVIPVTMPMTGMDELKEYCLYFEDYKIEAIEDKLNKLQEYEVESLQQLSDKIYSYATDRFSLDCYTETIASCFKECFDYLR